MASLALKISGTSAGRLELLKRLPAILFMQGLYAIHQRSGALRDEHGHILLVVGDDQEGGTFSDETATILKEMFQSIEGITDVRKAGNGGSE